MILGWIDTTLTYEEAIQENEEAKENGVILIQEHFFEEFFNYEDDYLIWYGSRASAKTWVKALQLLYKCASAKYCRVLFARQTQKDARESQYQLFEDLITRIYPFLQNEFTLEKSKFRVTHKKTGHFLKGASFENMPRSLAEYTDFWVDEPITAEGSIERKDLVDISGTLRNSYGVKSQKHLTFNPISVESHIYKDFFDPEKKVFESSQLLCNYEHNVFCPPEKIIEYESYKDFDYPRYLVDCKGQWGNPTTGNEWLPAFNGAKHVGKVPYILGLDVGETHDFNLLPYQTCIMCQLLLKNNGVLQVRVFKEYCSEPPHNYQEKGTEDFIRDYIKPYGHTNVRLYGDASGGSGTDAYRPMEALLKKYNLYPNDGHQVFRKNPSITDSRDLMNEILAGKYDIEIIIDESCKNLINDLQNLQTSFTDFDKKIVKGVETMGHCYSALKYYVCKIFEAKLKKNRK